MTPIGDIQANPAGYNNQVVTVQGQVYVPADYRGTLISGYIQDSSNRGINIFGNSANNAALFDIGNVVQVTGTVSIFSGTTVEIINVTNISLLSSGNLPLEPQQVSTAGANSSSWEGTFIEVTGTIASIERTTNSTPPSTNYSVDDGSGATVVRVADTASPGSFTVGQTITGRGAGSQFQSTYQILVGRAQDVFEAGGGGDTTPPTLTDVTANSATEILVSFNEPVSASTAIVTGNYEVFETGNSSSTVAVTAASLGGNGLVVTLTLGAALSNGVPYTLSVNNVEDEAGNAIVANSTRNFTYSAVQTTRIADIQADPAGYNNQVVTIQGQVYVPANYRGTLPSGYIQDSSNRGINLFGSMDPALFDIGNIVRVTGTVSIFSGTTVEVTNLTEITLVSSGNTPLQPQQVTTAGANSSSWEGTFIEVTGTIASIERTTNSTPPSTNYTVNDGSGATVVRVADTASPGSFTVGQMITGRGAGTQFQSTYQILVGRAQDVFETGGDTTPPTILVASAQSATEVVVGFSEAVTGATAEVTSNYEVYETAQTTNTIPIAGATLSPGSAMNVTLTLGASLQNDVSYTVSVNNVEDLAGNPIAANSTRSFTYSTTQTTPIADIQANPSGFTTVTIQGQVYIPANYRGTLSSGYIQDGSGRGINLFGSMDPALLDISNIVRVTGTVEVFQTTTVEVTNLTNITRVSTGNPPLQPEVLSTRAAANSAWEGTFIESSGTITGSEVAGPGTNYTINDGTGALVIRVVDALGLSAFPVGHTLTARGAGSQFSSTYQILVGRTEDISAEAPPEGGGTLSLSGPPFTFIPSLGETYPIQVSVPPSMATGTEILLRVFDLQGRLRRTLMDNRFDPVLSTVRWNGRDDATELVPAGTYVVHLVVVNKKTGSRETKQMPVVVASRLNR